MDQVTVNTKDLLAIVRQNREKHATDYADAMRGFRAEAREKLQALTVESNTGTDWPTDSVKFTLVMPSSHLDEYDTAIQMLEMSTEGEVKIDNSLFRQLVRDQWAWKQSWEFSNTAYITKAKSL